MNVENFNNVVVYVKKIISTINDAEKNLEQESFRSLVSAFVRELWENKCDDKLRKDIIQIMNGTAKIKLEGECYEN